MIVWVNGPFGGGKSSVAAELLHHIPHATLYDPEEVGFMLRNLLPGRETDFQDLAPWRPLVVATALELIAYTGGPLITPMSLLREDYAEEIFNPLRTHGTTVRHVVLHADRDTMITRIQQDHTHSSPTRAFRLRKLDDYLHAYNTWLTDAAHVIDTSHITSSEAANQIAKLAL
ncbi:MAG: AAA family ATPase [Pseudonocardiaceae bacterium]